MNEQKQLAVQALQWTGQSLKVLDQRRLPEAIVYDEYYDANGVAEAIQTMRVRGAPAIGIAAAYAVVLSVQKHNVTEPREWRQLVAEDIERLAQSRPTAVNLFWALEQMKQLLKTASNRAAPEFLELAIKIHADDISANHALGEMGADVLGDAKGLLTHCNAGALATGGYGTALGVIRSACQRGARKIYAGETRPWLQGARLTIWELAQDGIPAILIADSAAAWLMKTGAIDWVVVGADRIASNGDTANKIGTYALAVLAKQHGVKVMVAAPTSTIDWTMKDGNGIEIEQRSRNELLPESYLQQDSLVSAWNPVFDVTPAELISAIVTERGVIMNPSEQSLRSLRNDICKKGE